MTEDSGIEPMKTKKDIAEPFTDERLFHEINLLRLEGYFFCLDPKEASRRRGKREFQETLKLGIDAMERRPVVISINPDYGQPSTTAYKILQAIIKKVSNYGLPASHTVFFSQRELARMVGRKSFGGNNQKQFLHAFMQLRDTRILCWLYDKENNAWAAADFQMLDAAIFSGKANRITQCSVRLNDFVIKSLNSRYTICLNYGRMQALEPIGTALYKHLFFHFSNIHSTKKRTDFSYNKDYADICTIWLGGLKVLRFRSKILNEQLGRHLEALKQIELISDYTIEKNAKGDGFTLMFYPGGGFFQDYENFYEKQFQKSLPLRQVTDEQQHNEPLSIVHYFYSKLFPEQTAAQAIYLDKETDLARSLLGAYSMPEIQDLIDYTLDEAPRSQFPIKTFGGVRAFVKPWLAERNTRASEQARAAAQVKVAREALLQSRYLDFRNKVLERSKANMTPEELKALEASIREQTKNYPGPAYAVEMTVRIKLDTAIANRFNVPSFEEWKAEMVA
jgi:hypothetical protein